MTATEYKLDKLINAHPHDGRYIYFIHCREFVKIGYSRSPRRRVATIRSSNPLDQLAIAIVRGSIAAERALHEFFGAYHHHGEWYRLTPAHRRAIKALPTNQVRFLKGSDA